MDNTIIKVRCRTNLDDYKLRDWPNIMTCRPLKGDAVVDSTGRYQLHVVSITHAVGKDDLLASGIAGEPFLIVELHKYYPGLDSCTAK